MQKVDLVIIGVGAVALVATVLGIVFYDDAVGEQTVRFQEVTREGAFDMETAVVAAGTAREFDFPVPDNATGAAFEVTVNVGGTNVLAGTVSFQVTVRGPDGNMSAPQSGSITLGAGGAPAGPRGSDTITISYDWADVPANVATTEPDTVDETRAWTEPATVIVTITAPGNQLDSLTYSVDITGDVTLYQRAPPTLPSDPATA